MPFAISPVAASARQESGFVQWMDNGVELGDARVAVVDFVGENIVATRGVGANSNVITVRRASVPAPELESQTVQNTEFGVSWSVTLPSGVLPGDLLLVLFSTYAGGQAPATASDGWVVIGDEENVLGSGMKSTLFAKIATGSDALTVVVNPVSNTFASYSAWRISGCSSVANVSYSVSPGGTITPTVVFQTHTPGDGAKARLWIAAWSWYGDPDITVGSFPSGYGSGQQSTAASGTNRTVSASAVKTVASAAESPGDAVITGNTADYQAWTIAVRAQ